MKIHILSDREYRYKRRCLKKFLKTERQTCNKIISGYIEKYKNQKIFTEKALSSYNFMHEQYCNLYTSFYNTMEENEKLKEENEKLKEENEKLKEEVSLLQVTNNVFEEKIIELRAECKS